jgi:glutaminase
MATPPTARTPQAADALCRAVKVGDVQQVNRLLAEGVNPSTPNELDGRTALHIAASDGDEQLARILLAKGANANAHDRCASLFGCAHAHV